MDMETEYMSPQSSGLTFTDLYIYLQFLVLFWMTSSEECSMKFRA